MKSKGALILILVAASANLLALLLFILDQQILDLLSPKGKGLKLFFLICGMLIIALLTSVCLLLIPQSAKHDRVESKQPPPPKRPPQPSARPSHIPVPTPPAQQPLDNRQWLKLAEDCVTLLDELDRHLTSLEPAGRELAEHVIFRLQEVLERSGVEIISSDPTFDLSRHQPEPARAEILHGTAIEETISPGFAIGRRVLRRARVRLIKN